MRSHYDVVIAGGGPAGSTVATLVKRYSPDLSVLVLERRSFPRHHVGESLLAGGTPVLQEMEAYDAVNAYDFPEKLGATYVWGRERTPWGFEFDDVVSRFAAMGQQLPDIYTKGWQVRRGEYDKLLLDNAAEHGAEVHEQARVRRVLFDGDAADGDRVTGVRVEDADGERQVDCTWFMDCTGQEALLGRTHGIREYDERMNNYAIWGYWRGAKWKVEYVGHPNLTRIFVATTPRGWIWYIPVDHDVVSVGFVTHRQTLAGKAGTAASLYAEELAACPEIGGLLDNAHLIRTAPDQRNDICVIQDWSYGSRRLTGNGWALAGDAAGFVDPILSSGVMLAHELGQKAAYAINSSFRAGSDEQIREYWDFYARTYQTYLKAYRDMAGFWYGNNFAMDSWWWEARRGLESGTAGVDGAVDLTDREAFTRVASGYANRAESLSLFGSYPLHEARKLADGLFGVTPGAAGGAADAGAPTRTPALTPGAKVTDGLYFYQGLVRRTRRVVNTDDGRYLDLHPGEQVLVDMLDGTHRITDLDRAADHIRELPDAMPIRSGADLARQLDAIGVLG